MNPKIIVVAALPLACAFGLVAKGEDLGRESWCPVRFMCVLEPYHQADEPPYGGHTPLQSARITVTAASTATSPTSPTARFFGFAESDDAAGFN